MIVPFFSVTSFEWDEHNREKNQTKHGVAPEECEEIFFNLPLLLQEDSKHSQQETRWYALGKTRKDRRLFIAFTMRHNKIRVISARDMSKHERLIYAKAQNHSKI